MCWCAPMKLSTCGRFVVLETLHMDREVLGRLTSWAEGKGMSPQDAVQLAVVAFVEALPERALRAPWTGAPSVPLSDHVETPHNLPTRSSPMLPDALTSTRAGPPT
jgi:hypothetical protein